MPSQTQTVPGSRALDHGADRLRPGIDNVAVSKNHAPCCGVVHAVGDTDSACRSITTELPQILVRINDQREQGPKSPAKESTMDGNFIGLVAVTLFFGIPLAAMYT